MIRAVSPLDSFVAREAIGQEFFNSLGYKRTLAALRIYLRFRAQSGHSRPLLECPFFLTQSAYCRSAHLWALIGGR